MIKPILVNLLLILTIANIPLLGSARSDSAQMEELVPDVAYQRKTDYTHVFSRAQFIYSLGEDDYLHHWIDRPLLINPALDAETATAGYAYPSESTASLMSLASYAAMQETVVKYGLSGFSFFPETQKRAKFYDYTEQNKIKGFELLPEFINGKLEASKDDVIKLALENPSSFKINDKVVITSLLADSASIEHWGELISKLKAEYGDTFIFLPDVVSWDNKSLNYWLGKYNNNSITAKDVAGIKEYLRKWLRIADGIHFSYVDGVRTENRTFYETFYKNFIIRLIKNVLAEPEFNKKYFGLSALVGHENNTRFGYTHSSDGTKTLRHSFEAAMSAHPDLINIAEWDEQNENTSLRPTVYNGYSSMRIMRYYTAKLQGQKPTPLPGDNRKIPNLIVSYRKTLSIGEKLQIELLNVPDSEENTSYTTQVSLEDVAGKVVYTSPIQTFQSAQMKDHTLIIPSETLATHPVLRPKINVSFNGHPIDVKNGLHYIHLRTSNWDYKWVKQPLRDLLEPSEVTFDISAPKSEGIRTVVASFSAREPLQHVEILDNDDVAYSYSADDSWHENTQQVIVNLSWDAYGGVSIQGNISLNNATARWRFPRQSYYLPTLNEQVLSFNSVPATKRRRNILIAIPRSQLGQASFSIELPGIYQGELAVKDLIKKTIYGIPGPRGLNLVFSHDINQDRIPAVIDTDSVSFKAHIMPRMPNSVLHLQAIAKSGRLYRSKPIVLESRNTTQTAIAVYSESETHPVKVVANSSNVPDIRYQFDPSHGSVLVTDAGKPFWGILGGHFAQATGRGGGNAGDDSPFTYGYGRRGLPKGTSKTAPDWVKLEGDEYALQFDGKSTHISLPQSVIPRFSGYTIDLDIKPDTIEGTQSIFRHGSYYTGSISIYLINGILRARYLGQYSGGSTLLDFGVELPAQKWSRLTIQFDQGKLSSSVNGNPGKTFPISGPGVYDTATSVGGTGKNWFKGQIKSLRIHHAKD